MRQLQLASIFTYVPDASAVVHNDDVERGVLTAVPAPEEVPANAAKAVDGDLQLCLSGRPHGVLSGGLSQGNQQAGIIQDHFHSQRVHCTVACLYKLNEAKSCTDQNWEGVSLDCTYNTAVKI